VVKDKKGKRNILTLYIHSKYNITYGEKRDNKPPYQRTRKKQLEEDAVEKQGA